MRFLVVIETQKVKSYLFASPIMRETRGASVLLDMLNRRETERLLKKHAPSGFEIVYLGGGSGRILFEDVHEANTFRDKVLNLYRRRTVNARLAVEVVERNGDECFPDWMRRAVGETQRNKLGRVEGVSILAGRWIRPCTSCGSEPAEEMLTEHGLLQLCRSCILKRVEVTNLYDDIKRVSKEFKPTENLWPLLKPASELAEHYAEEFIFTTLARRNKEERFRVFLPQDLNDIGEHSMPRNYIGFIYADGNRMGEVVKHLAEVFRDEESAKQAYKAFSRIIDEATRQAAVDAVMTKVDLGAEKEGFRSIPAEFIMAGGDDLMLIVPAQNALDVAALFMETFQARTLDLQNKYVKDGELSDIFSPRGLTTSAGVVIAHAHYPVSDLMSLARDLMKLAKKKSAIAAKADAGFDKAIETGTIDFMVLTESVSEPAKDRRAREYTQKVPGSHNRGRKVSLTERPYTAEGIKKLLSIIRELKRSTVPRTKLKALYSALFRGTMQAQFDSLLILERLKSSGDLKPGSVLDDLVRSLDRFPFRINPDPDAEAVLTTPLTEIIELYDFVRVIEQNTQIAPETSREPEATHD